MLLKKHQVLNVIKLSGKILIHINIFSDDSIKQVLEKLNMKLVFDTPYFAFY